MHTLIIAHNDTVSRSSQECSKTCVFCSATSLVPRQALCEEEREPGTYCSATSVVPGQALCEEEREPGAHCSAY